jgi:hypothetical protein
MQQQSERRSEDRETEHSLVDAGGGIDDDLTTPPNKARPHVPHGPARLTGRRPDAISLGVQLQRSSLHRPEAEDDVRRRIAKVELGQCQLGPQGEAVRGV